MTTLREEAIRAHPDFPWLEAGDTAGIARVLRGLGWLEPGERIESAKPAGAGNMNLTLRIVTDRRRFVLKQARPWVEKYPEIPAPWDRSDTEQAFYARIGSLPEVASRMPRLLERSGDARMIVIEDLEDARDMTSLYAGDGLGEHEIDALADYLAALHTGTTIPRSGERRADADTTLANRAMRTLNHEHIFRVPLDPENGLDLERHEPGLGDAARRLMADSAFVARADALGRRYLEDGSQLVHGDYFPGSWLRTADGIRIIDPEFGHFGAAEFDLGCAVAHLALAGRPAAEAHRLVDRHAAHAHGVRVDPSLVAGFAAIEVVRRLIGVAQLPIAPTTGARSALLERARTAIGNGRREALFA